MANENDRFLNEVVDTRTNRKVKFQHLTEGYNFQCDEEGASETFPLLCDWEDSYRLADYLTESATIDSSGKLIRHLPTSLPSLATFTSPFTDNPLPVLNQNTSISNPATLFVQEINSIEGIRPQGWDEGNKLPEYLYGKVVATQKTVPYSVLSYEDFPKLLGFDDANLTTDVYFRNETTYLLRYLSRGCGRSEFTQSLKPGLVHVYYLSPLKSKGVLRLTKPDRWFYFTPEQEKILRDTNYLWASSYGTDPKEYKRRREAFILSLGLEEANQVGEKVSEELMTNSLDLKFGSPEYHLTWHKVPSTTLSSHHRMNWWMQFIGYCNKEVFDGHEPGSLLLTGLNIKMGRFFNGNPYGDVTFIMKQRNQKHAWEITDSPQEAVGHNSFLHVDRYGVFKVHNVTHNGLRDGKKLFEKKYFHLLFKLS